MITLKLRD